MLSSRYVYSVSVVLRAQFWLCNDKRISRQLPGKLKLLASMCQVHVDPPGRSWILKFKFSMPGKSPNQ